MDTFNLESALIGSVIRDGENAPQLFPLLSPEDFAEPLHREVFTAAKKLYRDGAPITLATLHHALMTGVYSHEDSRQIEDTLKAYAKEAAPDPSYYAHLLLETKALEDMHSQGMALSLAANLDEARDITRKLALTAGNGSKKAVKTALSAALDFADYLEACAEKPPVYLDWGMAKLNAFSCTEPGDFIIIGGRPSAGKTLFALQAAISLAKTWRVGFVSLETSVAKLTRRAMAHLSGVPLWKLKNPAKLDPDDRRALLEAQETFSQLNLEMVDSIRTVAQIEAVAINRSWDVVIVDYIQIVQGKGSSRYEVVTNISQELHTLAQQHHICVIGLAQLSRGVKSAAGREAPPTLESLRESGQLEQDADAVMLLYLNNPEDKGSNRILKVAKNKEGECGWLEMIFKGETQTFYPT